MPDNTNEAVEKAVAEVMRARRGWHSGVRVNTDVPEANQIRDDLLAALPSIESEVTKGLVERLNSDEVQLLYEEAVERGWTFANFIQDPRILAALSDQPQGGDADDREGALRVPTGPPASDARRHVAKGTSGSPGVPLEDCEHCRGKGSVPISERSPALVPCARCNGTGKQPPQPPVSGEDRVGDLTRWILDALDLPADVPQNARMQRKITAALESWFSDDPDCDECGGEMGCEKCQPGYDGSGEGLDKLAESFFREALPNRHDWADLPREKQQPWLDRAQYHLAAIRSAVQKRSAAPFQELASTLGRARVYLDKGSLPLAKRELNGAAEAMDWLARALSATHQQEVDGQAAKAVVLSPAEAAALLPEITEPRRGLDPNELMALQDAAEGKIRAAFGWPPLPTEEDSEPATSPSEQGGEVAK